jgi:hypothetical protein
MCFTAQNRESIPPANTVRKPPPYGLYAAVAEDFHLAFEFTSGQIVL